MNIVVSNILGKSAGRLRKLHLFHRIFFLTPSVSSCSVLSRTSHCLGTLGKSCLSPSSLLFLMCQMRIIVIPIS